MNTVINFKTQKSLKDDARLLAQEIGLPLGTILNHYLRDFVREKRVVFSTHPEPSTATVAELRLMSKDIKAKKNLSPKFKTAKEAMAWLET